MRLLGIDPSTSVLGWAVLEESNGDTLPHYHASGIYRPKPHHQQLHDAEIVGKLVDLHKFGGRIFEEYRPQIVVVEEPILAGGAKYNPRGTITLAQGWGALVAGIFSQYEVRSLLLKPTYVKKACVGYGNASKEDLRAMIPHLIFNIPHEKQIIMDLNESDALAICYAGFHTLHIESLRQSE